MGAQAGSMQARRLKLHAWADHFGMDRDERIEFAKTVLHRDIVSWKHLDPDQVNRLLDCFEGAALMDELRRQRPR